MHFVPLGPKLVNHQASLFRINANSSLCINDKQNFLSSMRAQLAKFLNTDPYNFLSIDCTAGSIIINFELVASDDVTAAQLSDAYNELVVYLQNGFLQLVKNTIFFIFVHWELRI